LAEILPKPCKIEYLLAKKTDYPSKGWEFFTGDDLHSREIPVSFMFLQSTKELFASRVIGSLLDFSSRLA
jgi:hypothetical protein